MSALGRIFKEVGLGYQMAFLLVLLPTLPAFPQKYEISLGPNKIAKNQLFTITLTARNADLDEYGNFPNIPGFVKAGTSSSSSMRSINGQVSNETSIIQNYMPEKEGTFKLSPFVLKVGGQMLKSPGTTITVGPAAEQKNADPFAIDPFSYDPFEDFFGRGRKDNREVKADALFSIQTDKKEIWAGEGLNVTFSFLVAEENQADLDFHDLGNQLAELLRKAKPANCWEENFGIEEIVPRRIQIRSKNYTEYRIYQGTWFPLTAQNFTIPKLKLDMVAYKPGSNPGFFGAPARQEIKPFYSNPIEIKIKDLPPHPLKGKVSVGQFSMRGSTSKPDCGVNEGVGVDLAISGEGNISYIEEPLQIKNDLMDVYPPNTRQTVKRSMGRITGEKVFSYLMIPKEQGTFLLSNAFYWVYFNTKTSRYDTLRPENRILVKPASAAKGEPGAASSDAFFSILEKADNSPIGEHTSDDDQKFWWNLALAGAALSTLALSLIRRSPKV